MPEDPTAHKHGDHSQPSGPGFYTRKPGSQLHDPTTHSGHVGGSAGTPAGDHVHGGAGIPAPVPSKSSPATIPLDALVAVMVRIEEQLTALTSAIRKMAGNQAAG